MLVGICGGSCSGKTTLIREIQKNFSRKVSVVSFDDYFLGKEKLDFGKITDWESPSLYDFDKFVRDLKKLRSGQAIRFECHSRESDEVKVRERIVSPGALTLVEGFLIYHHSEARSLFDKKIFIELPEEEILKRRILRRKWDEYWDNLQYIKTKFLEGQRKHVFPQKRHADLVLDGRQPLKQLVQSLLGFLDYV